MIQKKRIERLRLVIILRLFIATFLLFLADFVFRLETYIFYYLILVVCGLSLFYLFWLVWAKQLKLLLWIQILIDCVWQTVLIYFTGAVDSMFAPIYILPIIGSGILIAPWSSFVTAGISSLMFTGVVMMENFGFSMFSPLLATRDSATHQSLYLFYATYVRITIYFVVAILTNYLTASILRLEERVRMQERLAFLGDITSTIAHEIRNPLAAISNSVEVLMVNLKDKLSARESKLMIAAIDESQRLKGIFQKILDYSKVSQLQLTKHSINKIINHVLVLFENSQEFKQKIQINKKYLQKDFEVTVDGEQMIDVLTNIIRNAFEAMPTGGVLTVDSFQDEKTTVISIHDSGIGISGDMLRNLFLPFKTTKKTGTGLGLAQAQKIISLHGGSVDIKSKPNQGTTVKIGLPRT